MQWFKHDTDANQDAKLQNVLLDYGIEGYGLYWYCIELIAGSISEDNLTFQLEHDARIIARNTGNTPQKVEEMMKYFVELGLFENSEGTITCMRLRSRLNKSMTSNPAIRKLITSDKVETKDYSGSLYFIHAKNGDVSKIKIGRSKNPHARLNDLKKRKDCLGFNLELIHTIKSDDCVSMETEYHRMFKSENLVDEWFYPSDKLICYLQEELRVDYDLTTITQIRLDKIRLEENKDNDRSIDQSYPSELVNRAFEHFWKVWKDTKKDIGKTDTTPKGRTRTDKWNKLFNKSYFKNHSEDEFKEEVTRICEFVVAAHNIEGFNRFHNMQCGKLFSEKQWRDE